MLNDTICKKTLFADLYEKYPNQRKKQTKYVSNKCLPHLSNI